MRHDLLLHLAGITGKTEMIMYRVSRSGSIHGLYLWLCTFPTTTSIHSLGLRLSVYEIRERALDYSSERLRLRYESLNQVLGSKLYITPA